MLETVDSWRSIFLFRLWMSWSSSSSEVTSGSSYFKIYKNIIRRFQIQEHLRMFLYIYNHISIHTEVYLLSKTSIIWLYYLNRSFVNRRVAVLLPYRLLSEDSIDCTKTLQPQSRIFHHESAKFNRRAIINGKLVVVAHILIIICMMIEDFTLICKVPVSGFATSKVNPCSQTGLEDLSIVPVLSTLPPTLASRYTSGCLLPFTHLMSR